MKLPKGMKKKKLHEKKVRDVDNGINLTVEQRCNLSLNLICPKCYGITSFINTLCKVGEIVIIFRKCDLCGKSYELTFKYGNLEDMTSFYNEIKKETKLKAYLCEVAQNFVITNHGKNCSIEDCKEHTIINR